MIVDKKDTTFADIKTGQVFELVDYLVGSLYIKIEYFYYSAYDIESNAVDLKTGNVLYIRPTDKVILINNATITY